MQFAEVSTANITPFLADTMVFDLPYVFTSQPALLKFLDGPVGSEKLAIERFGTIGMRGLCWYDTGTRDIYNSRKPIVTPDDLKGMKIRVEENPVRVAALNAMGAQATPMSFAEVYGALQQKVVDGAENSAQTYMANKHNEVAPLFSLTDHFITPNCVVVSTKFFGSLPKELRLTELFDQSLFVRAAINDVVREGVLAALLTGLMILLFLRDWRSALIVVINIPLSLMAAVLALWISHQTVNIMTLGGLALAVGILVDEATVSIENIHTHLTRGASLKRAARDATTETSVPRLLAMLSVLAMFVPTLFMVGAAKAMFLPLSLAVGFSMIASYLLSKISSL